MVSYLGGHDFGEGHTLPLAARHAADELVPDTRLPRMRDPQVAKDAGPHVIDKVPRRCLLPRLFARHLVAQGEI